LTNFALQPGGEWYREGVQS